MRALDDLFPALARSAFRAKFRLDAADLDYLRSKGLDAIAAHAADFVARRLAPAAPARDGRQTPWRGHPVFVAQHATATCCRGCLEKWHDIPRGRVLVEAERAHAVAAIVRWLAPWADAGDSARSAPPASPLDPVLDLGLGATFPQSQPR
jgi:Domain of unknown function (DUF4186)